MLRNLYSLLVSTFLLASQLHAGTTTWDGRHDTSKIEVTVVYFVPADRTPLLDWRDRVDYFCRRIEQFHEREFEGLSVMKTKVIDRPLTSKLKTAQLRQGDADAIFFNTLRETDERLKFGQGEQEAFPILLVLSEINWRPLDDFYRVKPTENGFAFEGNFNGKEHFPGATSGGARATYLADRGVGWGLASADGWRVPYRGTDCVVYHEGCGHTVGLPHPEPGNGSVMSQGQYRGWISESWLDKDQKVHLGWEPQNRPMTPQLKLFSEFRAIPEPKTPQPGQTVTLKLDWPDEIEVDSLRVRYQTAIHSPWIDVPQTWDGDAPSHAKLASFERETPVSYRVDAKLKDGSTSEIWGYFQVRDEAGSPLMPPGNSQDLTRPTTASTVIHELPKQTQDLLADLNVEQCWKNGDWKTEEGVLTSPKMFGARLELPVTPPERYRLVAIVEPLEPPNGLILGQRIASRRFVTLFNYSPQKQGMSAIENIDGRNVGNESTFHGNLFQQNQLSQVIVTVSENGVMMSVDGHMIANWEGTPDQLSLSDYWKTPNEKSLFIGSYDCRYRFHRLTLQAL